MKKVFTILVAVIISAGVFAQAPEKMSYQAVIRDLNNNLVTNQTVGMQISILQGSLAGPAVYIETHTPLTNDNGLVSLEIGTGVVVDGDLLTIDWANDIYFIKTETDPEGSTDYSITGISQLLSVPYALHAKTANSLTGEITETDPVFSAWDKSTGISITESQVSDLDHFTTADETDPNFNAWDKSTGISITESQISDLDHFTTADETDPNFNAWDKSTGISITESQITDLDHFTTADETDPNFNSWDKSTGISITESQISDLDHFTTADETDPNFNAWDKSTGISITESQISDLDHFTTADETDPAYSTSVASGITQQDTTNWNNKSEFDGQFSSLTGVPNSVGVPVGVINMFAGNTPPVGYLICDGSEISRATYSELFAVIGTTYGFGDNSTTFNLPNFGGRVPVGVNALEPEFNALNNTGGAKEHTLTTGEMPNHTHTGLSDNVSGHTHLASAANDGDHGHTATTGTDGAFTPAGTVAVSAHNHTASAAADGMHSHTYSWAWWQNSTSTTAPGGATSSAYAIPYVRDADGVTYNDGAYDRLGLYNDASAVHWNQDTDWITIFDMNVAQWAINNSSSHSHALTVDNATPTASFAGTAVAGHTHTVSVANSGLHSHAVTTQSAGDHSHNLNIDATGGGAAHNNLQPYIVINYIIKY